MVKYVMIGKSEDESVAYHYNFEDGKFHADCNVANTVKAAKEGAHKGSWLTFLVYPFYSLFARYALSGMNVFLCILVGIILGEGLYRLATSKSGKDFFSLEETVVQLTREEIEACWRRGKKFYRETFWLTLLIAFFSAIMTIFLAYDATWIWILGTPMMWGITWLLLRCQKLSLRRKFKKLYFN